MPNDHSSLIGVLRRKNDQYHVAMQQFADFFS